MTLDRFATLMAEGAGALDETLLAVAAVLRPGLDIDTARAQLDRLASRCEASPDAIARLLFDDEYFVGNRSDYHDWRNSCLDQVLSTRRGIPISLSVVMMEVGRRLGVPIVGVGMPAHFLTGVADDPDTFFDPFNGSARLDRADARRRFEEVTSGQMEWEERFLDPTANRDIVIRTLNNLQGTFARSGDRIRLGVTMQLRAAVAELAAGESAAITAATAVFN
jgi:regulator of sirC expression with transglutaminase-like and TPR domain